jgi:LysR family glycine cleavage system transcriptional activator
MTLRLDELHTFVVVARAGSMKRAAAELGVTPGAISQRIRALEVRGRARLFARDKAGLALTEAGRRLNDALAGPFGAIEHAAEELGGAAPARSVRLTTLPSFAASWLAPRLGRFTAANPDIAIAVETERRLVDLRSEPVDLAIRHGLGRYPGLEAHKLAAPAMIVVGSPQLADVPTTPADCLRFPLMDTVGGADWRLWLQAQGIDSGGARFDPSWSEDHLLLRAAAAGQGLALVHDAHAGDAIARGEVSRLLDIAWPSAFAYYLVGLPESFDRPAVRRFARWLIREAGGDGGQPKRDSAE